MAAPGTWTSRPHDMTARPDWAGRPSYAVSDFAVLLWRERFLMASVFAVILVLGVAVAFTLKTSYPAYASVLVRLGQEYVYEPRAGDAGRGQSLIVWAIAEGRAAAASVAQSSITSRV